MSATARPVRVVLLDRTVPLLDQPEKVMLAALLGVALTAYGLLRAGWKWSHR